MEFDKDNRPTHEEIKPSTEVNVTQSPVQPRGSERLIGNRRQALSLLGALAAAGVLTKVGIGYVDYRQVYINQVMLGVGGLISGITWYILDRSKSV